MSDAPPGVRGDVVEFRAPGTWYLIGLDAFLAAMWLGRFLLAGPEPSRSDLAWSAPFVVLLVVGVVVQWRARIRVSGTGLEARDQLGRRRRLGWAEVHHFEQGGYWRGLGAWTVDGRWVRLVQYGAFEGRAAAYVTQLEAYRWERQRALGLA